MRGLLLLFGLLATTSFAVQVTVDGSTILFNKQAIFIKGVNYSPAPIGKSITEAPYGDFWTKEYAEYWARDLPLLVSMGTNTIRIMNWNASADHLPFLEACYKHGLKVLVTFFSGPEQYHSIVTQESRDALMDSFISNVKRYAGHPALLGWVFGNEMNNPGFGYLATSSIAWNCNWNGAMDPQGCYFNPADQGPCQGPVNCLYSNLIAFLDSAADKAHEAMGLHRHLVITVWADVDILLKRLADFERFAPHIDAWGADVFKGSSFGSGDNDFISSFERLSKKPLLITEYGVDAYDDPCGRSNESPCYNSLESHADGFGENQRAQAEWDTNLASLQLQHSSAEHKGSCAGGFVSEWLDQWWKASVGVKVCWGEPYGRPGFNPGLCEYKAHAECPNKDVTTHSLCGEWAEFAYDQYSNPAFYGLMQVIPATDHGIDRLMPREAYTSMKALWSPVNRTWLFLVISTLVIGLGLTVAAVSFANYKKDVAAHSSDETSQLLPK